MIMDNLEQEAKRIEETFNAAIDIASEEIGYQLPHAKIVWVEEEDSGAQVPSHES